MLSEEEIIEDFRLTKDCLDEKIPDFYKSLQRCQVLCAELGQRFAVFIEIFQ